MATVALAVSLVLLVYVYVGYPMVLRLIVRLRGPRPVEQGAIEPPVTLIVSAFNEDKVIRAKIENCLALDYPRDRLEVMVVSDASSDATDSIVAEYADRGVVLARQDERLGKTAGLNRAVPRARGEIVVFSDANAMYQPDALRMLVRNFADPEVGCVTGEARYVKAGRSAADVGERAYWDYEIQVKRLETAVGSMVGGDGAIYAIRKRLWRELPSDAINDFLNPLQIAAAGHRCVYEPHAVALEETAGDFRREYSRRVRIVSRSWRAVFQATGALDPRRTGLFAFCLFSHKVLRWFTPVLLIVAMAGATGTVAGLGRDTRLGLAAMLGVLALVVVAVPRGRRLIKVFAYYALLNAASLVGIVKGSLGRVSGVWTPPRLAGHAASPGRARAISWELAVWVAVLFVVALVCWAAPGVARATAWVSATLLAYVYVGYPLCLAAWRAFRTRPVGRGAALPSVTMIIPAHNEEAVIAGKILNTLDLDYPADLLEVLVVSDGSTDQTVELARRLAAPRVRLLDIAERSGKMSAINAGMAGVTSDVVLLTDANAFLQRDALRAIVRAFADPRVGAVSGDVVLVGDRAAFGASEDVYYRYERWLQQAESDIGSMIGVDGALYAVRRELVPTPPVDTILDDLTIAMAVVESGYRVVLEPTSMAVEQGSLSAVEEFSRKTRVIAGAVQFMRRLRARPDWPLQVWTSFVSHKALRWLSPVLILLLTISVSTLGRPLALATVVTGLLALGALGLLGSVPRARRIRVVGLAHYFFLLQAAAAVGLVRGLLRRQPVAWERFDRSPVVQP